MKAMVINKISIVGKNEDPLELTNILVPVSKNNEG